MVAGVLAVVYVLWGSTSPAMKIAVSSVPPFWMAAIRFAFAGSIMWTWCRARGVPMPTAREWRDAGITGILLLVLSNAVYAWTLQYLPSGVDSLVFALSPLWMALFAFAMYGERLSWIAVLGLAIGLGGMVFLYSPAGGQGLAPVPTAIALFASLAWGFGSIVSRRLRANDVMQNSTLQMLAACATLVVVALVVREPLRPGDVSIASLEAIAYLAIFGSVVGFSAYLWLMSNVPTTLASTYAYVNPIVSLIIGIGFLHEPFSLRLLIGALVIVLGVAIMIVAPKPVPR